MIASGEKDFTGRMKKKISMIVLERGGFRQKEI